MIAKMNSGLLQQTLEEVVIDRVPYQEGARLEVEEEVGEEVEVGEEAEVGKEVELKMICIGKHSMVFKGMLGKMCHSMRYLGNQGMQCNYKHFWNILDCL